MSLFKDDVVLSAPSLTSRFKSSDGRVTPLGVVSLIAIPVAMMMTVAIGPASALASEASIGPLVQADANLTAQRITTWSTAVEGQAGSTHWLLLENAVDFRIGAYAFKATRAAVRIDRRPVLGGVIHDLAVYLQDAEPGEGSGAIRAASKRLLITASTRGEVNLSTDLMEQRNRSGDALVQQAIARLARRKGAAQNARALDPEAGLTPEQIAQRREAARKGVAAQRDQLPPITAVDPDDPRKPFEGPRSVLPNRGVVSWHADSILINLPDKKQGRPEGSVVLVGGVRVLYQDAGGQLLTTLKSENAVVFFESTEKEKANRDGGSVSNRFDAKSITGVYLEGNVIVTDGDYTVRSPRVYYDVRTSRALLLDTVFFLWDARRRIPLYLRAEKITQEARDVWVAKDAILTTSDFREPHFAIGSSELTIRRERDPLEDKRSRAADGGAAGSSPLRGDAGGRTRRTFEAVHNTTRLGGVPVFYWPYLTGEVREPSLKRLTGGYDSDNGVEVQTRWDVFMLAGIEPPPGVSFEADIDYRGQHGGALGVDLDYDREDFFGQARAYALPFDQGTDDIGGRNDITRDGEFRGFLHWQHRQLMADNWELSLEGALVSDEAFLEEFFETQANDVKPFETSAYLKRQEDGESISVLLSGHLNGFTEQLTTLQNPGYAVDKLPEVAHFEIALPVLDSRLTYYTENRGSVLNIRAGNDTPAERGFLPADAMQFFGLANINTRFDQAANAAGIPEGDVIGRLDSRHELQAPMELGFVNVTPYLTGRVTGYTDSFRQFAGEGDQFRLHGVAGVRMHTQVHQGFANLDSTLLDMHQLRHIIEPSIDISLAGSTVNPEDIPVFDPDVEGLTEGGTLRLGLRNTLQTKRGGEGRMRSVDWLIIDTDVVLRSDDADINKDLTQFFGYRPELTTGGDAFIGRVRWMLSDAIGLVGESTYNLERNGFSQWRVGANTQHGAQLSSFIDLVDIDLLDSRLLTYGFNYQLTRVYRLGVSQTISLRNDSQGRSLSINVTRQFRQWRFVAFVSVDEINDTQTFGFVVVPTGIDSGVLLPGALPE